MKKTNRRSRTDPHKRNVTETIKKKATPERREHGKQPSHKHGIMHVWFNEAWHGKVHKQHYKLCGAQYAMSCILTNHHIRLFSSLPFMYPTILNVIKHGKG